MKRCQISEYKNNKILQIPLSEDGSRFFSFGIRKAKAILENISDIEEFVKEYDVSDNK